MAVKYECDFNLGDCIRTLGLNEGGIIQRYVSEQVRDLCDPYVPFREGKLKDSAEIIENNSVVIWDTPYATYQWNGIVYEDPKLHCAGFQTGNGWRSRKDAEKIPTERSLEYYKGSLRGPRWVDRMLQNGGRKKIEDGVRNEVKK